MKATKKVEQHDKIMTMTKAGDFHVATLLGLLQGPHAAILAKTV
jgi:hypothetical protein